MPPKGYARNETGFIKWITEEEFNLLLTGLDRWDYKFRMIFKLLFYTGIRRGEACRLKWIDIANDFSYFIIRDVKNGDRRKRMVSKKLGQELESYKFILRHSEGLGEYIFKPDRRSGSKNQYMQPSSVTAKFKQARDRTGLTEKYYSRRDGKFLYRITPHTCRHWFITEIHKRTNNLITTQRIIGHRKPETTARYIFDHQIKEIEKKLVDEIY